MKNSIRLLIAGLSKSLCDWIHAREFFRPKAFELQIGLPTLVEVRSCRAPLSVVFEDDGETAYFYALDYADQRQPIQAAFHIYSVADFGLSQPKSQLRIAWSDDGARVDLSLDRVSVAVVDFESRRGNCRSGFQLSSNW